MNRWKMLIALLPILSLIACENKNAATPKEATAAPASTTAPAPKVVVKKVAMDQLKLKAAKGWEGEFNKAMSSWTYEKYIPAGDGTNDLGGRFYIDAWDTDMPAKAADYAKKLKTKKGFQDMGYIWTKAETKDIPGGWMISGVSIDKSDKEAKPEEAFVMNIGGCSCRGSTFKNKAMYDEAVAACQSIKP